MEKEGTKNHPPLSKLKGFFFNPSLPDCPYGGGGGWKGGKTKTTHRHKTLINDTF